MKIKKGIKVGQYFWKQGIPIPDCDGDGCDNKAEYKIFSGKIGIRSCKDCLIGLKMRLNELIKDDE